MRISGWLLRFALNAMIVLSLVLSWVIWSNPSQANRPTTSTVVAVKSTSSNRALKSTIFLPNEAYWQNDAQKVRLYANSGNVVKSLHDTMADWRVSKVAAAKRLSSGEFRALLTRPGTLQLTYSGMMAYRQLESVFFKQKAENAAGDFKFNRLIVDTRGEVGEVVFVNDETMTVYEATMADSPLAKLLQTIKRHEPSGLSVIETRHRTREITYYTEPLVIASTTFLIDKQNANRFISLLMPATRTSEVETREIGDETVYTVNSEYRLTQSTTSEMAFSDESGQLSGTAGLTRRLDKAYTALSTLNLQGMSNMQYVSYDPAQRSVVFSAQALGLPVFSANGMGRVEVRHGTDNTRLNFSLRNLTVVIPTTQEKTKLPSTSEVVNALYQHGYNDTDVDDIVLAYDWQDQSSDNDVVTLKPTYYVSINGEYRPYTEWLAENREG